MSDSISLNRIEIGDAYEVLSHEPDKSVQMCVTSPPYYNQRDYGVDGQIGREKTPNDYVARLVQVFDEVKRVLKDNGTLFINIGDTYVYKELVGIPWRLVLALKDCGWILKNDIIWNRVNPMPESVKNRFTKSHEYVFFFSKSEEYLFNQQKEPCSESNVKDFLRRKTLNNKSKGKGSYEDARPDLSRSRADYMPKDFMRNKRDVWTVQQQPFTGGHFASYPPNLIRPCVLAGSNPGDVVLDPFMGAGTTVLVCQEEGRKWVGIELNAEYAKIAKMRIAKKNL
jgi:site-specific DNA-methyltransferase (adenine-specific)